MRKRRCRRHRRAAVVAVGLLALGLAACEPDDVTSAQPAQHTQQFDRDDAVAQAKLAVAIDAFRDAVRNSPFYAVIDWSPPRTLDQLRTWFPRGMFSGTITGAEPSELTRIPGFEDPEQWVDLPNWEHAVAAGVDLVVTVDDVGADPAGIVRPGDVVRVRIPLWTGQRDQVYTALIERVRALAPIGARVLVPQPVATTTPGVVGGLFGFFEPLNGAIVPMHPELDPLLVGIRAEDAVREFDPA